MKSKIFSATTIGVDAHLIEIEADLSFGLINFYIVGLPDKSIKESRDRIKAALKNSGFRLPQKTVTVNLAPADLKKEGVLFDLPIAISILIASDLLEIDSKFSAETLFLGELSLYGQIRHVRGALPIAHDAAKMGKKRIIVPKPNTEEASLIEGLEVIGVESLVELVAYLRGEIKIEPTKSNFDKFISEGKKLQLDFNQVKGQFQAKRALQIAAAGNHNILFIGPPGSGKTMLAKRLVTILPAMSFEEALETTKIYSVSGKLGENALIAQRPFRYPHHTISQAGLVGGGSIPVPGEISLSHNGVLFLDELTEFRRTTLEVLRQPLESRHVLISRANMSVKFPSDFLLVVALNPCPCGFFGDKKRKCTCSQKDISNYLGKLSGPLLDRIDLHINVSAVEYDEITAKDISREKSSAEMYKLVEKAVSIQKNRLGDLKNSSMSPDQVEKYCELQEDAKKILKQAFEVLNLSMRGYHKILKIARTIADLDLSEQIQKRHIQEAIMYRSLDQVFARK